MTTETQSPQPEDGEPIFHLRSYGDVSRADLMAYANRATQAPEGGPELTEEQVVAYLDTYRNDMERVGDFEAFRGVACDIWDAAIAAQRQAAPTTPEGEPLGAHLLRLARKHDLSADFLVAIRQAAELLAAPAPQAPVALTEAQRWEIARSWRGYEVDGPLTHYCIAKAEAAHGIPAPQTKEPTNDR